MESTTQNVQIPTDVNKPTVFIWTDLDINAHNCAVIADQEGLTAKQKWSMVATIHGESGFDTHAINYNYAFSKLTGKKYLASTDYGICQINDYYHIGQGKDFPSVDYVVNNPEACVRWMCKMWKMNKQNLWCAWNNKSYLNFMPKS